jgi:hypothetical protein
MRNLLLVFLGLTLSACGGGPKVPDWKLDSISLIERYKKAELKGQNKLAESYFEQALAAAGSAARIEETARLHLTRCATRQASLGFEPCSGYIEYAGLGATAEDEAYHRFISGQWDRLDAGRLPAQYRDFASNRDPARNAGIIQKIDDPLSRLVAVSIAVMRKQADDAMLKLAAETASEQGWRKPLLVYLKLQETQAGLKGDQAELEKLRARIKLVEGTL